MNDSGVILVLGINGCLKSEGARLISLILELASLDM